ncbi:MAG: single-stranded DNA-binding protein [Bryobacterales bacterium]|nr:single-stranded DNA-binding protein [Bryobacterales bacterium]
MYSKTVVVGRVGRDVELKYSQAGMAIATTSLAEDRGSGDNKRTVWWRLSFFRQAAESANEHIKKGDVLIVEGQATASAWIADDGEARAALELTAHAWRFGGGGSREDAREPAQARDASDVPF